VGFDLYTQLLEQAVKEFKGEEPDKAQIPLPTLDLPVAAVIPEKYITSEPQRILMYKKLSAVREKNDIVRLQEEFEDRFGDPPPPVWNALALLRLRLRCQEVGIESVTAEGAKVSVALNKETRLPEYTFKPLLAAFKAAGGTFTAERATLNITGSKVLQQVEEFVEVLARAIKQPPPARTSPGGSGPIGSGATKKRATPTRR
jgi:transcription-repair coupling factor (superfamily II helicase)